MEDYKNYKPAPQGKAKTAFAKAWQFLKTKALALGLAATMIVAAATLSACGGPEKKDPPTPEPPGIENPGPDDDKKEPDDKKDEGEETNPGGDGGEGDEKEEPGDEKEEPNTPEVVDPENLTAEQKQKVINTIVPIVEPNVKKVIGRTGKVDKYISIDFDNNEQAQEYKTILLVDYSNTLGTTTALISVDMATKTTAETIINSPETIKTLDQYATKEIEFSVDKEETRAQAVYDKLVADEAIESIGTPDYYGMRVVPGSTSAELNCGIHYVDLYTFNKGNLAYNRIEVKSDAYNVDYIDEHLLDGTKGTTYRKVSEESFENSNAVIYDYENGLQVVQNSEAQTANILLGDKVVGTIENGRIHWNKDEEMEL